VEFSISEHRQGDSIVIAPSGEIDMSTSGQLNNSITAALRAESNAGVIVELSNARFLDTTGIQTLLKGRHVADECGKKYEVARADGFTRNVLEVAGLWQYLNGQQI